MYNNNNSVYFRDIKMKNNFMKILFLMSSFILMINTVVADKFMTSFRCTTIGTQGDISDYELSINMENAVSERGPVLFFKSIQLFRMPAGKKPEEILDPDGYIIITYDVYGDHKNPGPGSKVIWKEDLLPDDHLGISMITYYDKNNYVPWRFTLEDDKLVWRPFAAPERRDSKCKIMPAEGNRAPIYKVFSLADVRSIIYSTHKENNEKIRFSFRLPPPEENN